MGPGRRAKSDQARSGHHTLFLDGHCNAIQIYRTKLLLNGPSVFQVSFIAWEKKYQEYIIRSIAKNLFSCVAPKHLFLLTLLPPLPLTNCLFHPPPLLPSVLSPLLRETKKSSRPCRYCCLAQKQHGFCRKPVMDHDKRGA